MIHVLWVICTCVACALAVSSPEQIARYPNPNIVEAGGYYRWKSDRPPSPHEAHAYAKCRPTALPAGQTMSLSCLWRHHSPAERLGPLNHKEMGGLHGATTPAHRTRMHAVGWKSSRSS